MIWNPDFEVSSGPRRTKLDGERLGRLADALYRRVPFYRRKMEKRGVKPQDVQGICDIGKLPFTTKDEMRDVYPYGLLAVALSEIVEIQFPGTTPASPWWTPTPGGTSRRGPR